MTSMMTRRAFLCGLALGSLAAPLPAEAHQAGKIRGSAFYRSRRARISLTR
jgi:hypothetical protein